MDFLDNFPNIRPIYLANKTATELLLKSYGDKILGSDINLGEEKKEKDEVNSAEFVLLLSTSDEDLILKKIAKDYLFLLKTCLSKYSLSVDFQDLRIDKKGNLNVKMNIEKNK